MVGGENGQAGAQVAKKPLPPVIAKQVKVEDRGVWLPEEGEFIAIFVFCHPITFAGKVTLCHRDFKTILKVLI